MKVESKVMVVTGGGNGIGREMVLLLLKKGAHVAAVDISDPALQETAALAGSLKERLSTHVVNIGLLLFGSTKRASRRGALIESCYDN